MNNQKKGFTLIELLVVIAIIGILSTIGLVALNGARAKARDTQRVSALRQYALAYQSWADSNGGSFVIPTATCAWDSDGRRASQCGTLKLFFGAGTNAPEDPSSTTSVTVVAANCATASTAGCFAQGDAAANYAFTNWTPGTSQWAYTRMYEADAATAASSTNPGFLVGTVLEVGAGGVPAGLHALNKNGKWLGTGYNPTTSM